MSATSKGVRAPVVTSAPPSAVPWLWCLGTCWTWSSSQNSPCVFRQAAWATMAWLPCRLKGDLTYHLWERSEYPDATILLIVAVFYSFLWQKSFMEVCIFKDAS